MILIQKGRIFMSKIRVAVIFGGKSNEHDVSVVSATHVIKSIPKDKYDVICIGITKKGHWMKYIGDVDDIASNKWEQHPDNVPCVLSPDPLHKGFIALGENGEYHTFCYDGPIFQQPVPFRLGRSFSQSYDIRLDDGTVKTYSYWFADLQALNTNSDAGTGPASE